MTKKLFKAKLGRLAELVNRIQTNVEELTPSEKLEFLAWFHPEFVPTVEYAEVHRPDLISSDLIRRSKRTWTALTASLVSLREFLLWLKDNLRKEFVSISFDLRIALEWTEGGKFAVSERVNQGDTVFTFQARVNPHSEEEPEERISVSEEKEFQVFDGSYFLTLVRAYDGIPLNYLKICDNDKCGKLFVQTSEREKRFCSQRCQNTVAVRRLRAKE